MTNPTEFPLELSLTSENAQRVRCSVVHRVTFYGTCGLFAQAAIKGGSIKGNVDDKCHRAWKLGTCPAMKMRQEEMTAGKSIYFKHVEEIYAPLKADGDVFDAEGYAVPRSDDPSYQRGWHCLEKAARLAQQAGIRAVNERRLSKVVSDAPVTPTPEAALDLSKIAGASMADVISAAMKPSKPATPASSGSGSLLELAQRMSAQGKL